MIIRLQKRILPREVIWQIPTNLLTRLGHFNAPVAPGKIVRPRDVVLISIRFGCGRVPSAVPVQHGRDPDLYRQLFRLPTMSV